MKAGDRISNDSYVVAFLFMSWRSSSTLAQQQTRQRYAILRTEDQPTPRWRLLHDMLRFGRVDERECHPDAEDGTGHRK